MSQSNWLLMLIFVTMVVVPVFTKILRKLFKKSDFYVISAVVYLCAFWFIYATDPMMH